MTTTWYKVTWYERGILHTEGGLTEIKADNLIRRLKQNFTTREIKLTGYEEAGHDTTQLQ